MSLNWNFEIGMPILFLIFLSIFIVFGIFPAIKRTYNRLVRFYRTLDKRGHDTTRQSLERGGFSFEPQFTQLQLDYYETEVLKQLALSGRKKLALGTIANNLHLQPKIIEEALIRLRAKTLVNIYRVFLTRELYYLSKKGINYAIAQGLIPFPDRRYRQKTNTFFGFL